MIGEGSAGPGLDAALRRSWTGWHALALLLSLLLHFALVASFRAPKPPPDGDDALPARPPVMWIAPLRMPLPAHEPKPEAKPERKLEEGRAAPTAVAPRPGRAPPAVAALPKPAASMPAAATRAPHETRPAASPPAPMERATPPSAREPDTAAPPTAAVPAAPEVPAASDKTAGSTGFDLERARKTARKLATAKWTKDEPSVARLRDHPLYPMREGTPLGRAIDATTRPDCRNIAADTGLFAIVVIPYLMVTDKKDSGCKW